MRGVGEHVDGAHAAEPIAGRRRAGPRSGRAWSGCTRRRRSAAPRTRSRGGRPSSTARRAAGRRRRRPGARPRSSSGRTEVRTSPAKKRALSISLRRALSVASAIASSRISTPHTSPARRASDEADRADAAEEVEDALARRSAARSRRRSRTAARPSRCWSGRTPRARSGAAARRAPRRGAPRRQHPGLAARAPPESGPRRTRVQVDRRARDRGRRGDEPHLDLPGPPALAHDEVAQQADPRRGGRMPAAPRCAPTSRTTLRTALLRSEASRQSSTSSDAVPAPAGVEAEHEPLRRAPRTSTRACCGSATARSPARSARARTPRGRRSGCSASATCSLLVLELALVAQRLPRRARAGLAAVVAALRRPGPRSGAGSRPRAPRRSRSSPASAARARGRRGRRPRRTRRSRSSARRRAAVRQVLDLELDQLARRAARARLGVAPESVAPIVGSRLAARPRHLRARGRAVRERDRPRVLPALRGPQGGFEIEAIYERHAGAVRARRGRASCATASVAADGERRAAAARYLLQLAVEGHIGQATKPEAAELAEREASARARARRGAPPVPAARRSRRRTSPTPSAARRSRSARRRCSRRELNPLHVRALERTHELARRARLGELRRRCTRS